MHLLLWVKDRLRLSEIDGSISAEIPSIESDPKLYEIVTSQLIHGPCGQMDLPGKPSICMDVASNKCKKNFPKKFTSETMLNQDGYPAYRRRSPSDGGNTFTIKKQGVEMVVDNSWVVPYSPVLCRMFECHINVEVAHSIKSIKYVCKVWSLILFSPQFFSI